MRAFSSAAARILAGRPRLGRTVARTPTFGALARVGRCPAAVVMRALRQARKRVFLHTAFLEQRGASPLVAGSLWSDFADAAIRVADEVAYRELTAQRGVPRAAGGAEIGRSVLGLGKLGARELNPSSDVDLLFAYGSDDDAGCHELFARWVRRVRELLADVTDEGFAFRVDLDLRPEGTTGTLVNSVDALESYYERFGRTWERAALLRLRPIVDAGGVGAAVLERLRPFVFPRAIDVRWIDDLASMKLKVTAAAAPGGFDVKRGEGGIREVEFVVQALQLLHGGRNRSLRSGSTVELLDKLEEHGLLPHRMASELGEAYLALRRVEHALQYLEDRQTQRLPDGGPTRERVARALAPFLWRGKKRLLFDDALARHRERAHRVFSAMLGERRDEPSPFAAKAVERTAPDDERLEALRALGFQPAEEALRLVRVLEKRQISPLSPALLAARAGLESLGARLVEEAAESPDPMAALSRLSELFSGVVHHALLERLATERRLSSLLSRVLAMSAPLTRILTRQAGLELVLLHGVTTARPSRRALLELCAEGDDDEEARLVRLRLVQGRAVLATGLGFLARRIGVVEVGHRLSTLADAILEASLALAREKLRKRFGEPRGAQFGAFALGRLGGRELGFFADVDLVFVYDAEGYTDGPRSIAAGEWAAKVAQQVISNVAVPLAEGRCYEVDTRLRPSGNQGPLVTTREAFARYHEARAELWERQALLRLRPVAGERELCRAVVEIARKATRARPPAGLGMRLIDMRARMVRERASGALDVKMGEGGIVDIEFAVQGLLLEHAHERPGLLVPSTRRALARLARAGLVRAADAEVLRGGLDRLSAAREALTLMDDKRGGAVTATDARLELLARAWPSSSFGFDDLVREAARVREVAHRVLVRL